MYGAPVNVISINSEAEELSIADGLGDVECLLLLGRPHINAVVAEACCSLLQAFRRAELRVQVHAPVLGVEV